SSLHVESQVVPGVADRVAWNAAGNPMFLLIVPGVPLITAKDATFVPPDVGFSADELVDIELQGLRVIDVHDPEIDVVGEVVQGWNNGFVVVLQSLLRYGTDQMHVPERVRPLNCAAALNRLRSLTVH